MKNSKKITSFILAIILLLGTLSCVQLSAFAATSSDYEYTVLDDGTAEITGYNGSASMLDIPSKIDGYTVTSIGDMAFDRFDLAKSITIPNSVISIGDMAFASCDGITSIAIPNGVKSIGSCAFEHCSKLTDITIADSVMKIGEGAFSGTPYYYKKSNWEDNSLYIGKHLVEINNSLSGTYKVKNGTVSIADNTFYDCTSLTSVSIPNSVKSIGDWAFYNCFNLTDLTIGNGIVSIADNAFIKCGITSITLPSSLISIGENAFNSCQNLKDVYFKGSKSQWNKVSIGSNKKLTNANIHFDSLDTPRISSTDIVAAGVQIKWGKVSGADMYRVFYKKNNESTWHHAADTASTSFIWTEAEYGFAYNFTVCCVSSDGKTIKSACDPTIENLDYDIAQSTTKTPTTKVPTTTAPVTKAPTSKAPTTTVSAPTATTTTTTTTTASATSETTTNASSEQATGDLTTDDLTTEPSTEEMVVEGETDVDTDSDPSSSPTIDPVIIGVIAAAIIGIAVAIIVIIKKKRIK